MLYGIFKLIVRNPFNNGLLIQTSVMKYILATLFLFSFYWLKQSSVYQPLEYIDSNITVNNHLTSNTIYMTIFGVIGQSVSQHWMGVTKNRWLNGFDNYVT